MTLTILSTNDLHGQLDPLLQHTRALPSRRFRVGGAGALAAAVAELRRTAPGPVLLLDAGDFMQGTLLSNQSQGLPMRDLMGLIGYDAVAIGNHEFDFGPAAGGDPADLRGALKAWTGGASFPVLAANITRPDGGAPAWPNVRPSVLLDRGGVKVGVVGLSTPSTPSVTMAGAVEGLRFGPMLPAAKREAAALRRRGARVVVLLVHAGGGCTGREAATCKGEAFSDLLDGLTPGLVDAVVMGHGHKSIWHRYRGMLVTEACSRGVAVGRLRLTLDRATGEVLPGQSQALPPHPVCHDIFSGTDGCDPGRAAPDAGVTQGPALARHRSLVQMAEAVVRRHRQKLGNREGRVIGRLARPLLHSLAGASGPGLLAAQAMLAAVPGADFSLLNPRAVRADLPAGEVTFGRLYSALPFDNRLATVQATPAQLRLLLDAGKGYRGDIFQVAGLRLTARCGRPPVIAGITHLDGRPLQPGKLYTVVITDFLLSGGDGLGKVLEKIPAARKRVLPKGTVRGAVEAMFKAAGRPLNTAGAPIPAADTPPLVIQGSPCDGGKRTASYLCR